MNLTELASIIPRYILNYNEENTRQFLPVLNYIVISNKFI